MMMMITPLRGPRQLDKQILLVPLSVWVVTGLISYCFLVLLMHIDRDQKEVKPKEAKVIQGSLLWSLLLVLTVLRSVYCGMILEADELCFFTLNCVKASHLWGQRTKHSACICFKPSLSHHANSNMQKCICPAGYLSPHPALPAPRQVPGRYGTWPGKSPAQPTIWQEIDTPRSTVARSGCVLHQGFWHIVTNRVDRDLIIVLMSLDAYEELVPGGSSPASARRNNSNSLMHHRLEKGRTRLKCSQAQLSST